MKKISLFRLDNFVFGLLLMLMGSWAGVSHAQVIPVEVQKLLITDQPNHGRFGFSIDMTDTTLVAAAYLNDSANGRAGAAYVFEKKGDVWSRVATLTTSNGTYFETFVSVISVAISGDTIVAGVDNAGMGRDVYVYEKPTGGWSNMTETARLTTSDGGNGGLFGHAVDISGDTIVVGAYAQNSFNGAAYVFEKPAGGWTDMTETAKLISNDGSVITPSIQFSGPKKINLWPVLTLGRPIILGIVSLCMIIQL